MLSLSHHGGGLAVTVSAVYETVKRSERCVPLFCICIMRGTNSCILLLQCETLCAFEPASELSVNLLEPAACNLAKWLQLQLRNPEEGLAGVSAVLPRFSQYFYLCFHDFFEKRPSWLLRVFY